MRGYVRKRGNKWSYTVDVGKDPITGKRKQKTKGGYDTEKEAEAALNETIYELNKGLYVEPQKIIMKDFATDWYDGYKHNLRTTTSEQYDAKIKKWIIPILGHYKVQDIKPVHGQMMIKRLLTELKPNTAHKVLAITKMILTYAVDLEIIIKNPFTKTTLKNPKRDVDTWDFDDLQHFLKVTKRYEPFYYGIFAVAAYTGLRKGEILGLSKSSVVSEYDRKSRKTKHKIIVKQSVAETKEKGVYLDKVKTPSSYRHVAIDSFIYTILDEQIKKNNELKLKFGPDYQDNDLIFCHKDGVIFRPSSLNRPFRRMIERSGVPYIRFHDLRHTHATLLLEMNTNPKIVADRLGHSSVKITLDTYSHTSVDMQMDIADQFSTMARKTSRGRDVVK